MSVIKEHSIHNKVFRVIFLLIKLFLVCSMKLSKSVVQVCSAKILKPSRDLATSKFKEHRTRTPKSKQTSSTLRYSYKQRAKRLFLTSSWESGSRSYWRTGRLSKWVATSGLPPSFPNAKILREWIKRRASISLGKSYLSPLYSH